MPWTILVDKETLFMFEVDPAQGTLVWPGWTMTYKMPSQLVPSLKFFPANVTLVSNWIRLVYLHVPLQLVQPCKGFSTLFTRVWPFTSVSVKMPYSMKFWKLLQAKRASKVWLHGVLMRKSLRSHGILPSIISMEKIWTGKFMFSVLGMEKSCDIVSIAHVQICPWVQWMLMVTICGD